MGPRSTPVAIVVAAAALAAGCSGSHSTSSDGARSNYRVLTTSESTALLRYAVDVRHCLVAHGLQLERPRPSRTRIALMPVGHWSPRAAAETMAECEPETGPPPPKSSLVAERTGLMVYIPKRCLLDAEVARRAA